MRIRADITEYITQGLENPSRDFDVYEHGKVLYMADRGDNNRINCYGYYNLIDIDLKEDVMDKFNVQFAKPGCDIICRCGVSNKFSAKYKQYDFVLECTNCKNKFTVNYG